MFSQKIPPFLSLGHFSFYYFFDYFFPSRWFFPLPPSTHTFLIIVQDGCFNFHLPFQPQKGGEACPPFKDTAWKSHTLIPLISYCQKLRPMIIHSCKGGWEMQPSFLQCPYAQLKCGGSYRAQRKRSIRRQLADPATRACLNCDLYHQEICY